MTTEAKTDENENEKRPLWLRPDGFVQGTDDGKTTYIVGKLLPSDAAHVLRGEERATTGCYIKDWDSQLEVLPISDSDPNGRPWVRVEPSTVEGDRIVTEWRRPSMWYAPLKNISGVGP